MRVCSLLLYLSFISFFSFSISRVLFLWQSTVSTVIPFVPMSPEDANRQQWIPIWALHRLVCLYVVLVEPVLRAVPCLMKTFPFASPGVVSCGWCLFRHKILPVLPCVSNGTSLCVHTQLHFAAHQLFESQNPFSQGNLT